MFKINCQIKNNCVLTVYWINIKLIKIAFFSSQSKVLKNYFVSLLDR